MASFYLFARLFVVLLGLASWLAAWQRTVFVSVWQECEKEIKGAREIKEREKKGKRARERRGKGEKGKIPGSNFCQNEAIV